MGWEIKTVEKEYEDFPKKLQNVKPTVEKLYYKGAFDESLFENCLAVVGTRRITKYGKQVVETLIHEVAAAGVTIVSGFMFGVDAAAHQAALDVGGRTVAVMPCGIELIIPAYQEKLYYEILENGGCVLSEIEGNLPPSRWTFASRNRIVAGLSKATLVIEGGEKSGTLITAGYAKKYNRKILAVPGPITSRMSAAPHKLIMEGAKIITKPADILEIFNLRDKSKKSGEKLNTDSSGENKIIEILKQEPMTIDELSRELSIKAGELNTFLSKLELSGEITEESGRYYLC